MASRSFLVEFLTSLTHSIITSVNNDNSISPFPGCIHLISFSFFIAPASASNTILKRNGDKGQPNFIPDFNWNVPSFYPFTM